MVQIKSDVGCAGAQAELWTVTLPANTIGKLPIERGPLQADARSMALQLDKSPLLKASQ